MYNKVILMGHLGADPETRETTRGTKVSNFRLATADSWKEKRTGQIHKAVDWHKCTAWGRLAEVCENHLTCGDCIQVEGKVKYDSYINKSGETVYTTYIHVESIVFIKVKNRNALPQGSNPLVDDCPF